MNYFAGDVSREDYITEAKYSNDESGIAKMREDFNSFLSEKKLSYKEFQALDDVAKKVLLKKFELKCQYDYSEIKALLRK